MTRPTPVQALILAALTWAAFQRGTDRITDMVIFLRRLWGFGKAAPPRPAMVSASEHVRRVANAYRAGLDLPGCGDPECSGCMPASIEDPALDALGGDNPVVGHDARFLDGMAPREGERVYHFGTGQNTRMLALAARPDEPFIFVGSPTDTEA